VGYKWVYAIKVGLTSALDRLDYCDTFSHVTKTSNIFLFLAMVVIHQWPLYQLDIKNTCLHGDMEKEIYMEQYRGFLTQKEFGLVCKLHRSLYGLKQPPRI